MTKDGVKCVYSAVQQILVRPNPGGGGGGGYIDIFIHTLAWVIFFFFFLGGGGVQNFEVQYFWGFSEKLMSFGV